MKTPIAAALLLAATQPVAALTSYHIGNSLTWDSRPDYGTPKLAQNAGLSLATGWHIRCNSSQDAILNDPTGTCVTPNSFGYYTPALTGHAWDAVTLQPFSGSGTPSTPRMEAAAMKSLIQLARSNPANVDTTFYVYTGWMSRTDMGDDYYAAWYDDAPVDPDSNLIRNNAAFDWVYNELASDPDLSGVDLQIIPVGDVLAELDRRMTLGQIPGFTGVEDLYRDDLHMNNLGWFAVSNTVLSALFKFDPTGTPTNSAFVLAPGQTETIPITPDLGAMIQSAVWDVVHMHGRTGFIEGDLDGDGFVGVADLDIVLNNWNSTTPPIAGDPSGDGFVGIADLDMVLGSWNAGTATPVALPEPAMLGLVVLAPLLIRTGGR